MVRSALLSHLGNASVVRSAARICSTPCSPLRAENVRFAYRGPAPSTWRAIQALRCRPRASGKCSIGFQLDDLIRTAELRIQKVQTSALAEQAVNEGRRRETN